MMYQNKKSKTVVAEAGGVAGVSTHRLCAERVLLRWWVAAARRRGVRWCGVVAWVRRKTRGRIAVHRERCDGSAGCCVPCAACHDEIRRFDLVVTCTTACGVQYRGKMRGDDASAPAVTLRIGTRF